MEPATKQDLKDLLKEFREEFRGSIREVVAEAFGNRKPAHSVVEASDGGLTVDPTIVAVVPDISSSTTNDQEVLEVVHDAFSDCIATAPVTCSTYCSTQVVATASMPAPTPAATPTAPSTTAHIFPELMDSAVSAGPFDIDAIRSDAVVPAMVVSSNPGKYAVVEAHPDVPTATAAVLRPWVLLKDRDMDVSKPTACSRFCLPNTAMLPLMATAFPQASQQRLMLRPEPWPSFIDKHTCTGRSGFVELTPSTDMELRKDVVPCPTLPPFLSPLQASLTLSRPLRKISGTRLLSYRLQPAGNISSNPGSVIVTLLCTTSVFREQPALIVAMRRHSHDSGIGTTGKVEKIWYCCPVKDLETVQMSNCECLPMEEPFNCLQFVQLQLWRLPRHTHGSVPSEKQSGFSFWPVKVLFRDAYAHEPWSYCCIIDTCIMSKLTGMTSEYDTEYDVAKKWSSLSAIDGEHGVNPSFGCMLILPHIEKVYGSEWRTRISCCANIIYVDAWKEFSVVVQLPCFQLPLTMLDAVDVHTSLNYFIDGIKYNSENVWAIPLYWCEQLEWENTWLLPVLVLATSEFISNVEIIIRPLYTTWIFWKLIPLCPEQHIITKVAIKLAKTPGSNGNCETLMDQHSGLGIILLGVLVVWPHLTTRLVDLEPMTITGVLGNCGLIQSVWYFQRLDGFINSTKILPIVLFVPTSIGTDSRKSPDSAALTAVVMAFVRTSSVATTLQFCEMTSSRTAAIHCGIEQFELQRTVHGGGSVLIEDELQWNLTVHILHMGSCCMANHLELAEFFYSVLPRCATYNALYTALSVPYMDDKQQAKLQYYQVCAITFLHLHRMAPGQVRTMCLLVDKFFEDSSMCVNCEDKGWCFLSSLLSDLLRYEISIIRLTKNWDPGGLGLQLSEMVVLIRLVIPWNPGGLNSVDATEFLSGCEQAPFQGGRSIMVLPFVDHHYYLDASFDVAHFYFDKGFHHDYTYTEEHQVPWDPGGITLASAWGQAEFQGGRIVSNLAEAAIGRDLGHG